MHEKYEMILNSFLANKPFSVYVNMCKYRLWSSYVNMCKYRLWSSFFLKINTYKNICSYVQAYTTSGLDDSWLCRLWVHSNVENIDSRWRCEIISFGCDHSILWHGLVVARHPSGFFDILAHNIIINAIWYTLVFPPEDTRENEMMVSLLCSDLMFHISQHSLVRSTK